MFVIMGAGEKKKKKQEDYEVKIEQTVFRHRSVWDH